MSESNGGASVGTVTVMFTDLVGSTEIRSRVGEDAAEALRAIHDAILTDAITAHEGRVVKHLGDGLMATFASSANAVAAAVALQQDLDLRNRRSDQERLTVRVGMSVGDVTFDGDDCFGLPVIEAQRLEASAAPGTIRCAELVMHLARGRGGHDFHPLGELELKGLAEPLAACEVVWSPVADTAPAAVEMGLPPVFAHGTGLPFSGKRCATGGFEVVLLAGEPGIGKTRLAQELAIRVQGGDGVVLGGRCDEDVTGSFQPFAAALDWFLRQHETTALRDLLGSYPGDLARLVPDLADRVPDLPRPLVDEPGSERLRLFQAVESWLGVGALEAPRLLVLDDVHWADKPTLLLLKHLISNPTAGLMVLCTYRDTDVDRAHPLSAMLADFRRMPAVTRIALDGLGDDGVRELLVRTGGHDLDDVGMAFAEVVQRETSGNPFFLGEVLRHLAETGALVERDGRWTSDLRPEEAGIPEGIREVVGRRLSRLGDEIEGVLRSAAVIGYEFDLDVLADVTGKDVDEVLDALDVAATANLAIEVGVGRHRFAHALVRETLHDELSATRRARQHRRVAEALELRHADRLDVVMPELATHWIEASAGGDPTRAIECSRAAGEQAAERRASETAATWFERALELIDEDDEFESERRRVLVQLAEAQAESGATAEARAHALQAARLAIEAEDAEVACASLVVNSRSSFGDTDEPDLEKIELLDEGLRLDGLAPAQRAALSGQLATELIFVREVARRREVIADLMTLLRQLPPEDHAAVLSSPGSVTFSADRQGFAELFEFSSAALAAATTRSSAMYVSHNRFFLALGLGDRATCDLIAASCRESAGDSVDRFAAFSKMFGVMTDAIDGEIERGRAQAREMVAIMRTIDMPETINFHTTTGFMLRRELGQLSLLAPVADVAETMGHVTSSPRAMSAFIRFAQGDADAAASALAQVVGEEFSDDGGRAIGVALWSELAVALGAVDLCRTLANSIAHQGGVHFLTGGMYLGAVDRIRALLHDALGEHDLADELFALATAQHEALRSPTWVARTQLDRAESLLRRGEVEPARVCLDAAAVAIGDLELTDSRLRLTELIERTATS